jgi:phage RecT family recombinase
MTENTAVATMGGESRRLRNGTKQLVSMMESRKEAFTRALGSRVDPEVFIQIVANAYMTNERLQQCSQLSLYVAALDAARTGLRPDGEEAALVPYRDRDSGEHQVQFQPMYQGLVRLMLRAGARKVWAHVVYSGDDFDYGLGLDPYLRHKPHRGENRGDIVAAYAVVKLANGETQFEVMELDELERVRKSSKSSNSPAYKNWLSEMYRKAPLRRLRKFVEMDADASAAFRLDATIESGKMGYRMGDFAGEHEHRSIEERATTTAARQRDELASAIEAATGSDDDPVIEEARYKAQKAADALAEAGQLELLDQERIDAFHREGDLDALIDIEEELRERLAGS